MSKGKRYYAEAVVVSLLVITVGAAVLYLMAGPDMTEVTENEALKNHEEKGIGFQNLTTILAILAATVVIGAIIRVIARRESSKGILGIFQFYPLVHGWRIR